MWRTITELYYGTPTAGHQSMFKAIGMVKRDYWWLTMLLLLVQWNSKLKGEELSLAKMT